MLLAEHHEQDWSLWVSGVQPNASLEEVTELLGSYFALCEEEGREVDPREAALLALGDGVLVEFVL